MADFTDADLQGARFVRTNLTGAVMRGVMVDGADIDAPWLLDGTSSLIVNGVDVAPFVDAELNRRFPGRSERRAPDAEGLRSAWNAVERAWASAVEQAEAMPAGTVDICVDGEWSFAQTLRHLVMATDVWVRGPILGVADPLHQIGMPYAEYEADGNDPSVFTRETPPFDDVLRVRAERQAMVRDFLATVTDDDLDVPRSGPWDPTYPESTRSCLHVVLEEEWEHLRFALRDLQTLSAASS